MLNRFREIVAEYAEKDNIVLTEDSVLQTDLGLNSFELVEVLCAVEEEYDLEIPDKEIRNFKTVGDVMRFVQAHRGT